MRIDGRSIAQENIKKITTRVNTLKKRGVIPTLAIVLVGENPASLAYINQKQIIGRQLHAKVKLLRLSNRTHLKTLINHIKTFNQDANIHGIIVQLPLPAHLDFSAIIRLIQAEKDVDGFRADSPFTPPVASAILKILHYAHSQRAKTGSDPVLWLRTKKISVLGRGQTAGKPIADTLIKRGCKVNVVHSQTKNPKKIIKNSDIVISCVGKRGVVTKDILKPGVIVVGVGLHEEDEKLRGDYDAGEIASMAAFYTSTPGGVGPVNVACLWENVVAAAEKVV